MSDERLDPVDGVIMMVAITIVIASVLGWLMFGNLKLSGDDSVCYNTTITVKNTTNVGIIDTDGRGYVYFSGFMGIGMSPGGTYATVYCVYRNSGDRIVMSSQNANTYTDAYKCTFDATGVCK